MSNQTRSKNGGGALFGFLTIVVALAMIFLPLFFGGVINMGTTAQLVVVGFGVVVFIMGAVVLIISRLYVRASADESFVRTGAGGQKAIVDGGALVIPVVHDITSVSHQTMKLEVARIGKDALITGDNLRADVIAEFYIKIPKTAAAVIASAATLGDRGMDPVIVKELVFQKLENVLRAVAGTKNLMELHADRKGFVEAVAEDVSSALSANGFELEEATISKLDQTSLDDIDPDKNIFDAQGATVIERTTSAQRVLRTKLKTEADQAVKAQEVETQTEILAREVELEQRQSATRQQKAEAEAESEANSAKAREKGQRESELAQVERTQAVEVANIEREKATDVASQQRQAAERTAEIEKQKVTEVAEADKRIAVEERQQALAEAEAQRQSAEKLAETERQAVKTVTVLAEAERSAKKTVVDEQGEIDKDANRKRTDADVAAYEITKRADADLEAADKKATAVRTEAEAARDAKVAQAEGEKASAMIPVEVDREAVKVEAERVQVVRSELEAKADFESISRELTVMLEEIAAGKAVDIARAEAMGLAMSNVNMTLWGDPTTFQSMTSSFLSGQSAGKVVEGLGEGLPVGLKDLGADALRGMGATVQGLVSKFTGKSLKDISPENIADLVKDLSPEDIAGFLKDLSPEDIASYLKNLSDSSGDEEKSSTSKKS